MNNPSASPVPPPLRRLAGWPFSKGSSKRDPAKTAENLPRISVVIPSYNQGRFLEASIRSVLLQDYPADKIECIVMDGGSTDESRQILEYYSPWLARWVSERDGGQAHAVNKGLETAGGEIIGWLNSDDLYCAGAFQRVARAFLANPECIVVHGDRIMIDETGHVCGWTALPPFDPDQTGYIVCSETAFWRRSMAAHSRLKEELRFAMDLEFFCRLYQPGRFVKLNAYLGYLRCHLESKSSTIQTVGQEETVREWHAIFGDRHEGWKMRPQISAFRQISQLFLHPLLVAFPYLYRRLILTRRGF